MWAAPLPLVSPLYACVTEWLREATGEFATLGEWATPGLHLHGLLSGFLVSYMAAKTES
jgi:hypothetical protein